tara:strand:- start:37 stop:396 length:360 start_codon:yes stop_codon:yes gene_type:complete
MLVELLEKRVVNRMVSDRKSLGIVERRAFRGRKVVRRRIQLGDLCFSQCIFCILQKACVKSCEAVIETGDLEAHEFDQCLIDRAALARRSIEAEVVVDDQQLEDQYETLEIELGFAGDF